MSEVMLIFWCLLVSPSPLPLSLSLPLSSLSLSLSLSLPLLPGVTAHLPTEPSTVLSQWTVDLHPEPYPPQSTLNVFVHHTTGSQEENVLHPPPLSFRREI